MQGIDALHQIAELFTRDPVAVILDRISPLRTINIHKNRNAGIYENLLPVFFPDTLNNIIPPVTPVCAQSGLKNGDGKRIYEKRMPQHGLH